MLSAGLFLKYDQRHAVYLTVDKVGQPGNAQIEHNDGVVWWRFPHYGMHFDTILDLAKSALSIDGLHFVAFFHEQHCTFHVDILDSVELDRFFSTNHDRDERRGRYKHAGNRLEALVRSLNEYFRAIEGGELIRLVLDVEKGAIYYFWVDSRIYLVGVTLRQEMVDVADESLASLVDKIRKHYEQPPIRQPKT